MEKEIIRATHFLNENKVILTPTDTIWGLSCLYDNIKGIKRIKDIKNRASGKFFIMLVAEPEDVLSLVDPFPEMARKLMVEGDRATTIVYPKARGSFANILSDDGSIAIRVVKNGFIKALINSVGKPIVSTSANISGNPSPKSYNDVEQAILKQVDYVVNSRYESTGVQESRILAVCEDGEIKTIRS